MAELQAQLAKRLCVIVPFLGCFIVTLSFIPNISRSEEDGAVREELAQAKYTTESLRAKLRSLQMTTSQRLAERAHVSRKWIQPYVLCFCY